MRYNRCREKGCLSWCPLLAALHPALKQSRDVKALGVLHQSFPAIYECQPTTTPEIARISAPASAKSVPTLCHKIVATIDQAHGEAQALANPEDGSAELKVPIDKHTLSATLGKSVSVAIKRLNAELRMI
ncbi:uncharacterized protein LOC131881176 [Tigriopus californicus]|uniref:uncharacterized protein LOC131881176 n=1 Tax=Tigriopus californicus TaxID=6832 RepID=UPI0027D9E3BD|nr:uncharacterized protein LOC131881176 [Tigriopus californicus]